MMKGLKLTLILALLGQGYLPAHACTCPRDSMHQDRDPDECCASVVQVSKTPCCCKPDGDLYRSDTGANAPCDNKCRCHELAKRHNPLVPPTNSRLLPRDHLPVAVVGLFVTPLTNDTNTAAPSLVRLERILPSHHERQAQLAVWLK